MAGCCVDLSTGPPPIVVVGNKDYIKYKGVQVIVTCSFVLIVIVYKLEVVVVGGKTKSIAPLCFQCPPLLILSTLAVRIWF